jgi:hypothetical protein
MVKNGAADLALTPLAALETLAHWLVNDQKILKERSQAAAKLGRPQAAFTIADFVWAAAVRGPLPVNPTRMALMPRFLEFLRQIGIGEEKPGIGSEPQIS